MRSRLRSLALSVLALSALAVAVAGCDSGGPDTLADVAGEYRASRVVITLRSGASEDFLDLGGSFVLSVGTDGRFTSRLALAAGTPLSEDGAIDDAVDGTVFVRAGSRVEFVHNEDSFLRDLSWTYADGEIRSDPTPLSTGVSYDIVLRR